MSEEKQVRLRVENSAFASMVTKTVLKWVGIMALMLMVVYIGVGASITRVSYTLDGNTFRNKEIDFVGGLAPSGSIVLVSDSDYHNGVLGGLQKTLLPIKNPSIVEVKAGPFGSITTRDGMITQIDGVSLDEPVDANILPEDNGKFLTDAYLVKCLENCENGGEYRIVPDSSIVGIPLVEKYHVKPGIHYSLENR